MSLSRLAIACLLASFVAFAVAVQCKDETGNPVDWWFIHKLPLLSKGPISPGGFGYYYADPKRDHYLSSNSLDTYTKGALGNTLNQYMGHTRANWIAWNDQPPGTDMTANGAHAKGVISFDGTSGFFLRHSTPRFPLAASSGAYAGYPDYARIYGQTFLCVSYSTATLNSLAVQLMLDSVTVYDAHISKTVGAENPNLALLAAGSPFPPPSGYASQRSFMSLGKANFTDFAKSKACNCELYTQLVAPAYASDMAVLSWGRPLMGPGCRPFVRYNVLDISGVVLHTPAGTISYNETKEHSKLGLTERGNVICVGDINRMTSQASRGGGTTCFSNASLWNALSKQIGEWKTCH